MHIRNQRHRKPGRIFHFIFQYVLYFFHLGLVRLYQKFVVYLEYEPGFQFFSSSVHLTRPIIAILMISAAVPWIGAFIATLSPNRYTYRESRHIPFPSHVRLNHPKTV